MLHKIKHFISNDSMFYSILIVLVALTAYGLGKQNTGPLERQTTAAKVILVNEPSTPVSQQKTVEENTIVASKNGTKYHLLHCPGAQQIKEENKIFFDTPKNARAAGYTPAANCKGLE